MSKSLKKENEQKPRVMGLKVNISWEFSQLWTKFWDTVEKLIRKVAILRLKVKFVRQRVKIMRKKLIVWD